MDDRPYRPNTKVLYIGGTGRTGSTLLTRLLGEIPGWFPGGELAFLWRFGLQKGGLCSCGQPLPECTVWSSVFNEARARGAVLDAQRMIALRRRCWSIHLPLMAHPACAERMMDRLEEFPATVEKVYESLADITQSTLIVDSSKEPHYSWILRERTDLDLYFIQLVRDPRAVAHSWRRVRQERGLGNDEEMERRGPLRASIYYDVSNVAAEGIWSGRPDRFRFLRYEDFVADPGTALAAIADFVGEPLEVSPLEGSAFTATDHHMAWGNPGRFGAGTVTIRADEEWRERSGMAARLVSTILTSPVAMRYGYPIRGSARHDVAKPRLRRGQILRGDTDA